MRILIRDIAMLFLVGYFYLGYRAGDVQIGYKHSPRQFPEFLLALVIGLTIFDIYSFIKNKNSKY